MRILGNTLKHNYGNIFSKDGRSVEKDKGLLLRTVLLPCFASSLQVRLKKNKVKKRWKQNKEILIYVRTTDYTCWVIQTQLLWLERPLRFTYRSYLHCITNGGSFCLQPTHFSFTDCNYRLYYHFNIIIFVINVLILCSVFFLFLHRPSD